MRRGYWAYSSFWWLSKWQRRRWWWWWHSGERQVVIGWQEDWLSLNQGRGVLTFFEDWADAGHRLIWWFLKMIMRISNPPLFTQLQEYAIPLYTSRPSQKYRSLLFLLYFSNTVNWIPSIPHSSSSSWGDGRAHFPSWSFEIHWPSGAFALSNLLISYPETFSPLHSKALHCFSIFTKLHSMLHIAQQLFLCICCCIHCV